MSYTGQNLFCDSPVTSLTAVFRLRPMFPIQSPPPPRAFPVCALWQPTRPALGPMGQLGQCEGDNTFGEGNVEKAVDLPEEQHVRNYYYEWPGFGLDCFARKSTTPTP
ncbi:hypothetical protein M405DRAFT_861884 [Rhizopogon salebrosus TDB-379]|nr:hypothetical protein M405DRAFT_861884 [Rhizopogon salebrosus TDB-379]